MVTPYGICSGLGKGAPGEPRIGGSKHNLLGAEYFPSVCGKRNYHGL